MKKFLIMCVATFMLTGCLAGVADSINSFNDTIDPNKKTETSTASKAPANTKLSTYKKNAIIEYLQINNFTVEPDKLANIHAGYGSKSVIYSFNLEEVSTSNEGIYLSNRINMETGVMILTLIVQKANKTDQKYPRFNKAIVSFDSEKVTFVRDDKDQSTFQTEEDYSGKTITELLKINYTDIEALTKLVNAKKITYTMSFANTNVKVINATLSKKDHDDLKKTVTAVAEIQKIIAK